MKKFNVGVIGATGMVGQRFMMLLANHPWFVGTLFNPEYHSTVAPPAPLFVSFVAAALEFQKAKKAEEKAAK